MKRKIQGSRTNRLTRGELIDQIEALRNTQRNLNDAFEEILLKNNANEDDSDPNEGMYNTMSDEELQSALNTMRKLSSSDDIEGLSAQLSDVIDTIGDLQDSYFNYDATFNMLIKCYDNVVRAKNVVTKFLDA